MNNNLPATFEFGIRKISPVSFFVNEKLPIPPEITIAYGLDIEFSESEETVDLTIGANFTNAPINGDILYAGSVLTKIYLRDLPNYIDKDKNMLNLPSNILEVLFSISFTHTRGVLATYTNGTKYSQFILPAINPTNVLKQLYDSFMQRYENTNNLK